MFSGAAASMAAFLCPQDLPFVLIIRGALNNSNKLIARRRLKTNCTALQVRTSPRKALAAA